MFFPQQFSPGPSGLRIARKVVGKCLVALAVGGQQQRDACAQEVTAERAGVQGQNLSKDRAVKSSGSSWFQLPHP